MINDNNNNTIVSLESKIILKIKKINEEKIKIDELDLRPFGLNIYGNEKALFIGKKKLQNNIFENIPNMIGLK